MLMASGSLVEHLVDHPWPGWQADVLGMKVTLMSAAIAAMIIAAAILLVAIPAMARRNAAVPKGIRHIGELLVIFVRTSIARPALHAKADEFLPFLLTLFVFILCMNLLGIVPLINITGLTHYPVGGSPTSIPTVCAALAFITLARVVFESLRHQAQVARHHRKWPVVACWAASPALWLASLSPPIPGVAGVILKLPMTVLELVGVAAKIFALTIRLFANILAGHAMLAVLLMFITMSLEAALQGSWSSVTYIPIFSGLASVLLYIMELLVAVVQAYIFTFLTAMFIGIYSEPSH